MAALRPTFPFAYPGQVMAKKAWRVFSDAQKGGYGECTMGALDPVQVVNYAKYLKTIYVSGW